jgi:hypothetical protein
VCVNVLRDVKLTFAQCCMSLMIALLFKFGVCVCECAERC